MVKRMRDNEFICPFCGHIATVEHFDFDNDDWYQAVCLNCGEPSVFSEKPEDAIRAWFDEAAKRKC